MLKQGLSGRRVELSITKSSRIWNPLTFVVVTTGRHAKRPVSGEFSLRDVR